MTFELDLTDLPAIYRDGKSSSLDKIKSGDTVVVTVRYNKVTTLETTPQTPTSPALSPGWCRMPAGSRLM